MNPRTTGVLLLVALALGALVQLELESGAPTDPDSRDRSVFALEADEITEIELSTTDERVARLRREEGAWVLVSPVAFPADTFAVEGLATALATLVSEGPFESPGPVEEYGLQDGVAREVAFEAGGGRWVLRLGRDAPVGSRRYLGLADGVHTAPRFAVNALDKSLDDLRNRDIVDFDRRRVRMLRVRWPGGGVSLVGEPESHDEDAALVWRITSPLEAAADQGTVRELLSEIDFLRADGFVDEVLASDAESPFSVTLIGPEGEEGEEPFELSLRFGMEREDGQILVRGGTGAWYTVEAARLDDFPRDAFAYRHKALARFSVGDAESVEFYFQPRGGGDPVSVVAERTSGGWSSMPEAMDPDRILPLVSELSRLEASAIVADSMGSEELAALELSPPNTIISVLGVVPEDGEGGAPRLAELRIGRIEGAEGVVVQRAGDPAIYRLPIEVGNRLPFDLEAFRNRFLAPELPEEIPTAGAGDELLTPSEESP